MQRPVRELPLPQRDALLHVRGGGTSGSGQPTAVPRPSAGSSTVQAAPQAGSLPTAAPRSSGGTSSSIGLGGFARGLPSGSATAVPRPVTVQQSGTQAAQATAATAVPRGVVNVADAGGSFGGQAGRQVGSVAVPRTVTGEEAVASGAVTAVPRIPAPGGVVGAAPRGSGAVPRMPAGAGAAATAAPRYEG